MAEKNMGHITQIIGAVLDIKFSQDIFQKSMRLSRFQQAMERY